MNKQAITCFIKEVPKFLRKHSPEFLTGLGVTGMVLTTITAVKATPKALRLIDETEIKDGKRLTKKEIVKTTWKCYIPSAITGAASIACVIGASSINAKRNAALAAAYAISVQDLADYKKKALEVVGEKKEEAIRDAIAKEKLDQKPLNNSEVIMTGKGETLCFDPLSGRYFKSDIEKLRKAENTLNRRMRDEVWLTLNDFYVELGLDEIDIGNNLGWDIDRGYIELDFSSQLTQNGVPCLVMGQHRPPIYLGFDR